MRSDPFFGSASDHGRGALRGKRFQRLSRDLYVLGPEPPTLAAHVAALQRVLPGAVGCLHTAALLTNLPVDDDGLVHLARAGDDAWSERDKVRVHRLDVRDDEQFTRAGGAVVSTATRTLSDLAAHLTLEELVAVGDVVLRRASPGQVREAVRRARGRPGVRLLRAAVPLMDKGSDSPAETRLRLRMHDAGFRGLRHGVHVLDEAGGWLADPDLADPVAKVAVQHDGEVHFEQGAKRRRHDADRDDLCRERGWEVVLSTALDDADPDRLVRRVTAAYLRAAERLGRHVLPPHLQ